MERQDNGGRKETGSVKLEDERWRDGGSGLEITAVWVHGVHLNVAKSVSSQLFFCWETNIGTSWTSTTAGWKAERLLGSEPSAEEGYLPSGSEGRSLRVSLSRPCLPPTEE